MWPSTWMFDCCACFPDLYRSRTLSASLFSSSLCLFLSLVRFQEFPPEAFLKHECQTQSLFLCLPTKIFFFSSPKMHSKLKIFFISTVHWSTLNQLPDFFSWPWCEAHMTWHAPEDGLFDPSLSRSWPLNFLLIIRPAPLMNLLPRESQETGSCDPVV